MRLRSVFTSFAAAGTIAAVIGGTDLVPATHTLENNDGLTTSVPIPTPRPRDLTPKNKSAVTVSLPEMNVPVPMPRPTIEEPEQIHLTFLEKSRIAIGYYDYCKRLPSECMRKGDVPMQVIMDERAEFTLNRINKSVNARIVPTNDID